MIHGLPLYIALVMPSLKMIDYRKVVNSRLSRLVAHPSIFKLFMKGKFDAYDLWPKEFKIE